MESENVGYVTCVERPHLGVGGEDRVLCERVRVCVFIFLSNEISGEQEGVHPIQWCSTVV